MKYSIWSRCAISRGSTAAGSKTKDFMSDTWKTFSLPVKRSRSTYLKFNSLTTLIGTLQNVCKRVGGEPVRWFIFCVFVLFWHCHMKWVSSKQFFGRSLQKIVLNWKELTQRMKVFEPDVQDIFSSVVRAFGMLISLVYHCDWNSKLSARKAKILCNHLKICETSKHASVDWSLYCNVLQLHSPP